MKKKETIIAISLILLTAGLAYAGSLQPTAAPASTMKTLDQVEPRIPIPGGSVSTRFEITTPGSYYLTGNRTVTSTTVTGIWIDCSNVTIDLMGYSLTGPDSGAYSGILINSGSGNGNIEIRNGTVNHFGGGGILSTGSSRDIRIKDIRSMLNGSHGFLIQGIGIQIEGCIAAETNGKGYSVGQSTAGNAIIRNCIARENTDVGFYVYKGSVVTECSSYGNGGDGFFTNGGGVTISKCSSCNNASEGIYAFNGSISVLDCICKDNGGNGIQIGTGGGVIKNNFVSGSGGAYGIYASAGSTIINNTANGNTNYGIYADNGCTIISNSASGNVRGIYTNGASLVDQNAARNNTTENLYLFAGCVVPSANYAP